MPYRLAPSREPVNPMVHGGGATSSLSGIAEMSLSVMGGMSSLCGTGETTSLCGIGEMSLSRIGETSSLCGIGDMLGEKGPIAMLPACVFDSDDKAATRDLAAKIPPRRRRRHAGVRGPRRRRGVGCYLLAAGRVHSGDGWSRPPPFSARKGLVSSGTAAGSQGGCSCGKPDVFLSPSIWGGVCGLEFGMEAVARS